MWVGKGGAKLRYEVVDGKNQHSLFVPTSPSATLAKAAPGSSSVNFSMPSSRVIRESDVVRRYFVLETVELDIVAKQRMIEGGRLKGERGHAFHFGGVEAVDSDIGANIPEDVGLYRSYRSSQSSPVPW